jgi:hypothetical protein
MRSLPMASSFDMHNLFTISMTLAAAYLLSQSPSPSRGIVSQIPQSRSQSTQQPVKTNQQGTEQNPLVIKQLPTQKSDEESAQEAKDRNDKAANDRKLVEFTGRLVTTTFVLGAIGILQLFVFGYQAIQFQKTVKAAADQSEAMERSIAEANRSAAAMENVAKHIEGSTKAAIESTTMFKERGIQQMRAYICVEVGTAAYQVQADDIKFAAQTVMHNVGSTPAHQVRFSATAAILPFPLPNNFDFPLPTRPVGGSPLGPNQRMNITRIVDNFVPEDQVPQIKIGIGQGLYIWGVIEYIDIFSQTRTTSFCQLLNWPDGKTVLGTYIDRHNEVT